MRAVAVASSKLVYASVKSTLSLSHVFNFLGSLLQSLHSSVDIPVLCTNVYAVLTTYVFVNRMSTCAIYSTTSSTCANNVSIGRLMSSRVYIYSLFAVRMGARMRVYVS